MTSVSHDGVGIKTLILRARSEFEELTGRPVDRVVGIEADDGGWRLTVETIELERVPASTNVIGTYDVVVGADGTVQEFMRTRRYHRNRADDESGN